MALKEYVDKRHLDQTPEPQGGEPTAGLPKFVVQKHRATRLHYDFRLEAGGVLLSWAVPKGPSLRPADKRLAMMVEDHPMDYRTFEGIIPKGNYGAGTVMVWDEGEFVTPDAANREEVEHGVKLGLHKGHITVFLSGQKLKGLFDVIKIKGQNAEENAWLLVKRPDEFASDIDVTTLDRSVLTGRSMEEIRDGAPAAGQVWYSDRIPGKLDLSGAPEADMPHNVKPMLAQESDHPFDRKGWLFEIKWDGYRAIAEVELEGDVRLYSRNQLSFNERYPAIVQDLNKIGHACVLDGEVVTVDDAGRAQFQWLQDYQKGHRGTLLYYVFDLLYLDGRDLRKLPLTRRKELLAEIIPPDLRVRTSGHVENDGCAFYRAIEAQDLEGMMAKNGACSYEDGRRSPEWLKVKRLHEQDAVIGGYTEPRNSRKHFGALVLGVCEDGRLVYVGHTGGGFDERGLNQVIDRLKPLTRDTSPFAVEPKTNMPVTWVEPRVVCTVIYRGWTESGLLRQPVFKAIRDTVDPLSVFRQPHGAPSSSAAESSSLEASSTPAGRNEPESSLEAEEDGHVRATAVPPSTSEETESPPDDPTPRSRAFRGKTDDTVIEIGGHHLKLTNLDKVLWPDDGYTKGDLIEYYRRVSNYILPYLEDRPESLHRHPNGVGTKAFFQKDMPAHTPAWIETAEVYSGTHGGNIRYLLCQNEATLVYMANLACIEINPWNSRYPRCEYPDYALIDLDPHEIGFDAVVETARSVRAVLDQLGIPGYPKTSGATGIHIYIPLGAKYTTGQTTQFAELVAQLVHARVPKITSLERMPARRVGKVYVDYLQNRDGQTLAAAYSVRPKPGATVSTPLHWDEVDDSLHPSAFTIRTIFDRLDKVGDLWQPVLQGGIDMGSVLEKIAG